MIALLLAVALPAAAALRADTDARIEDLLKQMTLEEKLGQLQQLEGRDDGGAKPEDFILARNGRLGALLNVRGAANVNALQRAAVEESRLKIPLLFGFDVIHGYRTVFPIPLALASSWDEAVVESAARVSAAEAEAAGVRWTFSPMVDVARDPRWGRVAEGSGEDPFLGAAMARAYVRGYQGDDPGRPGRLAACAKHWVAYGAAEGGRDYGSVDVSERSLREIYFPPFQAALEAGALTFMSAFNDLNGVPASANPFTLTQVLRREWSFSGFVVSDYGAVSELVRHGIAADGAQAARLALGAGVDMEMASRHFPEEIPALARAGTVATASIDEAVRRVLRVKFALGLFERPYVEPARESAALAAPEHRHAAREAAVRSMILLKNDGDLLPLGKNLRRVALIGPLGGDGAALLGSWSGDGKVEDVVTLAQGLRAKLPEAAVIVATGCAIIGDSDAGFSAALAAAREADAVVLALGESADMSGEASSRSDIRLPGRQQSLAEAVLALNRPTVVVLFNGRPLAIPELAARAPAILEAWQPGTEGGAAVADVLFGDASPGGKLPMTFPRSVGQVPLYYNHRNTGRPPTEGERYTSKYIDGPWTPLFRFGHGLSYARTRVSGLSLSAPEMRRDGSVGVAVDVENAGPRAGDEVLQLYVRRRAASVTRPTLELKGFSRMTLAPGEKRRVNFTLGPRELGFLGPDLRFGVEPGLFDVMVGTDSAPGLSARLLVTN